MPKAIHKVGRSSDETLESVRDIETKISIINNIAFQTNILALNAAGGSSQVNMDVVFSSSH